MLNIHHLAKRFGEKTVVDHISFDVPKGSLLVLLGKSGCGKTTTLKMINRLIEPTSGNILINDQDVTQLNEVLLRRKIGYVVQNYGLFPHLTVEQNIAVVPRLLQTAPKAIRQRVLELLELLHLDPDLYLHKYPSELSGGQQQRVAIARALAAKPPLLLMDEPFSALDPLTRSSARRQFAALQRTTGTTVVMVTHDISEAIELADQVCLLDQGKIRQKGTTFDLIFHPENEFVRSFFDENRLEHELSVLQLHSLLPYLPLEDSLEKAVEAETTAPLYDTLSRIAQSKFNHINIREKDQLLGSINQEQLLTAYSRFRQSLSTAS
jgi:osmoprotectant transport system ATP-binding protein